MKYSFARLSNELLEYLHGVVIMLYMYKLYIVYICA